MKNQDLGKEKQLLENAKADVAQFENLYQYFIDDVYRFSYSLLGNQHDAEDIASQTFLNFYGMLNSFVWQGVSLKFWLFKTARNLCYEKFRLPVTDDIDEHELSNDNYEISFVDQMIQDDLMNQIQNEMKLLSSEEQEVINLRIWEGFSYVDIAKVQNSTEEASRKRFNRAITKIKSNLSKKGIQVAITLPLLFTAIAKVGASSVYAAPASLQTFSTLSITGGSMGTFAAIRTFLATKTGIALLAGTLVITASAAGTAAIVYNNRYDVKQTGSSSSVISSSNDSTDKSSTESTVPNTKKVTNFYYIKDTQVWGMDIDTKEQAQITNETYSILSFDVSRDGKYLAYTGLKNNCEGVDKLCYTGVTLIDLETLNSKIIYSSQASSDPNTANIYRVADRPMSPVAFSYDSQYLYFAQNNLMSYSISTAQLTDLVHKPESPAYVVLRVSPDGRYVYTVTQHLDNVYQAITSVPDNKVVYTHPYAIYPTYSFADFAGGDEVYMFRPNNVSQPVNGQIPDGAGDSIETLNLLTNETRVLLQPNKQSYSIAENNNDNGLLINVYQLSVDPNNPSGFTGYSNVIKSILFRDGELVLERKFNHTVCYSDNNFILTYEFTKNYGSGYNDITRYIWGLDGSRNEELIKMVNIYDFSCNRVEIRTTDEPLGDDSQINMKTYTSPDNQFSFTYPDTFIIEEKVN